MNAKWSILILILSISFNSQAQLLVEDSCSINICSFNVYLLGGVDHKYKEISIQHKDARYVRSESSYRTPDRITNCASLLSRGNFSIIVLQEVVDGVRGDSAVADLTTSLNRISLKGYKWFTSERIGKGMRMESMAFIYDSLKVDLRKIEGKNSALIACSEPRNRKYVQTHWLSGDFDFTLISCHFAWNDSDYFRRQADYKELNAILHQPLEYSVDPDVIVLGDFNRFGGGHFNTDRKEYGIQQIAYDFELFRSPHIESFDSTLVQLREVHDNPYIEDPQLHSTTVSDNTMVYDTFWITSDVFEEFELENCQWNVDYGVMVYDEPNGNFYIEDLEKLTPKELKYKYSDHRPIWMRFSTCSGKQDQ
ncbi:MAG: hypothetical protein HON99_10475 [Crocinitomicaceae bacterium]|nr:hypothetical protein [Crocinitomicaceae bacterium]